MGQLFRLIGAFEIKSSRNGVKKAHTKLSQYSETNQAQGTGMPFSR